MKIVFYRVYQFIFSRITRLFQFIKPEIIKGDNCILNMHEVLIKNNVKHPLIVTTAGTIKRKTLDVFFKTLTYKNIEYSVYCDVPADPTIECVENGVKIYKHGNCDGIICVGGGSVIDCGKIIGARIARSDKKIPRMKGLLKIRRKLPFLIAVPTTAGTGSEATAAAVITGEKRGTHYKYPISDYFLVPKYAYLDPSLTISLPPFMSITTGIDALTHAMEAYTNENASRYVKKHALEAMKLIFENINEVGKNPTNIEARRNMLLASTYAGIAFNNNFVGYVHAIAHAVGGLYGYSHGEANSVLLVPVMKKYMPVINDKLTEIAEYCKIYSVNGESKAQAVLNMIDNIKVQNGISFFFDKLDQKDYKEIVNRAIKEANPTYPVPVIWEKKDFIELLESVRKK